MPKSYLKHNGECICRHVILRAAGTSIQQPQCMYTEIQAATSGQMLKCDLYFPIKPIKRYMCWHVNWHGLTLCWHVALCCQGYDLRDEHFHGFNEQGEGGHYHWDTTPDTVHYRWSIYLYPSSITPPLPAVIHTSATSSIDIAQ